MVETRFYLMPELFAERERVVLEHGPLAASTFRFASGVIPPKPSRIAPSPAG
jgi:hypothetical protein